MTSKIQDTVASDLAEQVTRSLAVMRIKGWDFPENADVGVLVLNAPHKGIRVKARIDDVTTEGDIFSETKDKDIINTVDILVAQWLAKHATAKPSSSVTAKSKRTFL